MVQILLHVPTQSEQIMLQETSRLAEPEDMLIGNYEHSRRFNSPDPFRVSAVRLTDGLTEGLQRPDVPEDHPLSRREIPADFQQSLCNQRNRLAPLMGGIQHLARRQLYTTDCT
jgi:hypothetical protein